MFKRGTRGIGPGIPHFLKCICNDSTIQFGEPRLTGHPIEVYCPGYGHLRPMESINTPAFVLADTHRNPGRPRITAGIVPTCVGDRGTTTATGLVAGTVDKDLIPGLCCVWCT